MEAALVLVRDLEPITARITDFEISNDTIYEATDFRAELKAFRKRVEDAEAVTAKPLKEAWEAAREPFLALRKKVDETEKLLNKRLSDWQAAENARRWEIEKRERGAQRLALEAAQKEAEKAGDVDTVIALEEAVMHVETKPQENKLKSVATGTSSMSFRDNWVFEIIDLAKVPDAYTVRAVSKAAVDAAIKAGTREIAGLHIWNQPIPVQGRR